MQAATATLPADAGSVAPASLRRDLEATERPYLGRKYIIYKNPISLAYFRLPVAHAEAASLFDGRTRLADLAVLLAERSRYWQALTPEQSVAELSALASQLAQAGLLAVRGANAAERGRRLRLLKKSRGFELAVGHVLFFRKSLFDPDRLLAQLLPWVAWIFRPAFLAGATIFISLSMCAALWNFERLVAQGANFFTLSNLGLTWLLFVGVKVLHEFGHGLTSKFYGAEVHEMGFMFILFTPYLFCNVSDTWRAGKQARIAVGAAGIVVELILASCALWLWLFSQPGLFNQLCFNTVVLCSVSTLLFNGNPLMKFDGYYILSDVLEIPNLRTKSNAWVTSWAQRTLLGLPVRALPAAGHEMSPVFGIYAVAAYCYGWFIMFSISFMMLDLLKPYGLEFLSRTYVALFLFVSLALPLYRLAQTIRGAAGLRAVIVHRGRFALAGAGLLVVLMLFVPWHETIRRSAALEHSRVEQISSAASGVLVSADVEQGDKVVAGQLLGRLANRDLSSRLVDLQLQREACQVRLRALSVENSEEALLTVPVLSRQIREIGEEISALDRKIASLELRSPRDGVLRTAKPKELVGRYFSASQPVFEVGSEEQPRLLIALDEKQARKVRPGQKVRVIFTGLPGNVFEGAITGVAVSPAERLSAPSFSNITGGDVPSEASSLHPGTYVPSTGHYEAEASVAIPGDKLALLRAQSSGRARIDVQRTTLARWLRERLYEVVNPQVRL